MALKVCCDQLLTPLVKNKCLNSVRGECRTPAPLPEGCTGRRGGFPNVGTSEFRVVIRPMQSGRLWVRPEISPNGAFRMSIFFLLFTELCCKHVRHPRKSDCGSSQKNRRRFRREGDPVHCVVHSSGHGCIQVSPASGLSEGE